MATRTRVLILIVAGVFGLVSASYAQDAARRQLAEELLVLTETGKNMEKIFGMMQQAQIDQVKKIELPKELSKEDSDRIASLQGTVMGIITKDMGWDKLKEDFIGMYAAVFTKEELEGITAFYKTPVGNSFIRKQPELMQKSMELSQKQMAMILPKIQKALQDMKDSIKDSAEKPQK